MPARAGTAYIEFEGDFGKLNKQVSSKLNDLSKKGKGFGKSLGSGIGTGIGAGAKVAAVGLGALTAEVVHATKGWADHEAVVRRSQAVIKSTGGAAQVTAKHVGNLSDQIERQTGVDGDLVQSGANLLLTFTNVRNGVGKNNKIFDEATKTTVNMSKALGQDTKSSAIQLGKALNDPVKGITALSRVGVSFTAQQKAQITQLVKSGDTMKAQKVILGELAKEFPKVKATPFERLVVVGRQVEDTIGKAVLPIFNKFVNVVTPKLQHIANVASDLFSDKSLNWGERFKRLGASVRHWFGPIANDMLQGLKAAKLDDKLQAAIEWATPKVMAAFSTVGGKAASALGQGFLNAPMWAQFATGAWILTKFGLTGALLKGVGTRAGAGLLGGLATGLSGGIVTAGALAGLVTLMNVVDDMDTSSEDLNSALIITRNYLSGLAKQGDIAAIDKYASGIDDFGKKSHFSAAEVATLRAEVQKFRNEAQNSVGNIDKFRNSVATSDPVLRSYGSNLATAREKLGGLKKGSDEYKATQKVVSTNQEHINNRLIQMLPVTDDAKLAVKELGINFAGLGDNVQQSASYIAAATNQVLAGLGAETIKFSLTQSKKIDKSFTGRAPAGGHQRGSYIAGSGTGDKYPIMAEAGEYVLNRKAVKKVGKSTLDRINFSDAPRFQKGGGIVALGRELQREGYAVGEQSHFGGVHPVHVPGSWHYKDLALDVNADNFPGGEAKALDKLYARLKKMKGIVELLWRVKGHFDHLHVAMSGTGTLAGGAATQIPALGIAGPKGMMMDILRGSERTMRGAANDYIATQAGAGVEGTEPGVLATGPWQDELQRIAKARKWNAGDWKWIIGKESGGKAVYNKEGSGAFGIGQLMPANYNRLGGAPGSSLIEQVRAMASYIAERYGNPSKARSYWEAHSSYRRGGFLGMQRGGTPHNRFKNAATPVKTNNSRSAEAVKARIAGHLANIGFTADQKHLDDLANAVALDDDMAQRLSSLVNTDEIQLALNAELTRRGGTSDMSDAKINSIFPPGDQDALIQSMMPTLRGFSQAGWLSQELRDLLGQRNVLIDEPPALDRMKKQVQAEINALNEVIKRVEKEIAANLAERNKVDALSDKKLDGLQQAKDDLKSEQRKKKPDKKRVERLQEHIATLSRQYHAMHDAGGGRGDLHADDAELIDKQLGFGFHHSVAWYDQTRADARKANQIRKDTVDTLSNSSDAGVVSLPNIASALSSATDTLGTIQGLGSPLTKYMSDAEFPVGTLGGTILSVQNQIRDLTLNPPRAQATAAGATDATVDDPSKALLAEQLRQANLRFAVSQAQYDIFKNFPAFGGAFAQGGVVPGAPGSPRMILAHGGEVISPVNGDGTPNISLHFAPGTEWLRNFVDVRVQQTTRTQARSGDRRLPGQAGVLR